jgi:hypothetical protein
LLGMTILGAGAVLRRRRASRHVSFDLVPSRRAGENH